MYDVRFVGVLLHIYCPAALLLPGLLLTLVFSPTYTAKDEGWTKDDRTMIGGSSGYYSRRLPAG